MADISPDLKVAISDKFMVALTQLPRAQQKKTMEFVSAFRQNPRSPGTNYEKVRETADPQYRSARIDKSYRAIVRAPGQGNVYLLLWVDKHDDALALLEEAEDQQQVASMLNVAAVMAINHGFQEKGLELFAMSVQILHDDWASLSKFGFNMGIAYFKQKDFENAGRCFGLAVALDPENSQAAENFSMLADLVSVDEIPEKRGEALEALARYGRSA